MECINYRPPVEEAATLAELEQVVERIIQQYQLEIFRQQYPEADWAELGAIVEEELDQEPEMPAVAYWLYIAEQQRLKLIEASRAGE